MKILNKISISALVVATLATTSIIALSATADRHIDDSIAMNNTLSSPDANLEQPTVVTTMPVNYFENTATQAQLKEAPAQITDQETLLSMMINSIDYFNTVSGSFHQSIAGSDIAIDFSSDMLTSTAYENIQSNNDNKTLYVKNGKCINYNNINKSTAQEGFLAQRNTELVESPSPDVFEYNITTDSEGIKNYIGREQATGLSYARMVLQPTEITFNYLSDLSKWTIVGNENYIGRNCIRIEGSTNDYAHTKLNVANFTFLVDAKTGILLKYEGYDDSGNVSDYMIVDNIQIDSPQIDVSKVVSEKLEENKETYQLYDGYDESVISLLTE